MKKRLVPMTPQQVESLGVVSPDSIQKWDTASKDILLRIDAAEKRKACRPQRSEDGKPGGCPPPTNRGGKFRSGAEANGMTVETIKLVLEDGEIKEVPKRRGWGGDTAFIDWVNLTIGEETIGAADGSPITPDQVMVCMSNRLHDVFGFGITSKREMGANFYRESWVLGDAWGMVCYGGQRGTIMVTLNGSGCAAAREGWEGRLKAMLEKSDRARLTRIDFAHDDYTGKTYSVDRANQDHSSGLFNCGGRNPDCEFRGNWKNPNGKGRTFNVGNRSNGKFCRVYEKGRQLGDKSSEWVRVEVEFKSCDRVIPFDALIRPGEYLAASYPAFHWINEVQERIFTTQKVVQKTVDKAVAWIRHQCGSSIGAMVNIFGVDDFLNKVVRDGSPKWTDIPNFLLSPESIHQRVKENIPVNLNAAASAW